MDGSGRDMGVPMDSSDFSDKLKRALEMEEEMVGVLVDLCNPDSLPESIPPEPRNRIRAVLHTIQWDTQRHSDIVSRIISGISQG